MSVYMYVCWLVNISCKAFNSQATKLKIKKKYENYHNLESFLLELAYQISYHIIIHLKFSKTEPRVP